MKTRRVQVLMEEERFARIAEEAERRGVSVAEVIRDALDRVLRDGPGRRADLWRQIQASPRMTVPDPAGLRSELDELRGARW